MLNISRNVYLPELNTGQNVYQPHVTFREFLDINARMNLLFKQLRNLCRGAQECIPQVFARDVIGYVLHDFTGFGF